MQQEQKRALLRGDMEIFRAFNARIAEVIMPFLFPSDDESKEHAAADIATRLNFYPNEICVMVCFDGNEIKALEVAWLTSKDYIWSAYSWSIAGSKISHEVHDRIEAFGRANGKTEIRGCTKRNVKAIERAYGYKYLYSVLRKEL